MEAAVRELEYDADKAPLGKLDADQIRAGYAALKRIEDVLSQGKGALLWDRLELIDWRRGKEVSGLASYASGDGLIPSHETD